MKRIRFSTEATHEPAVHLRHGVGVMRDRSFFAMIVLLVIAQLIAIADPAAAIAPALMVVVLGFEEVIQAIKARGDQ